MNRNKSQQPPESESRAGFPYQLILLAIGILIGFAILVLELTGSFGDGL